MPQSTILDMMIVLVSLAAAVEIMEPQRWAVVTGASTGIGHAMTHAVAARGFSVVATARSTSLLTKLQSTLKTQHKVDVVTVSCDLSTQDCLSQLRKVTRSLNVELLVANAGSTWTGGMRPCP